MQITDARDQMPRAEWSIGMRKLPPTGITLHYFGPGAPNYADDPATFRAMAAAARNRHMAPASKGGLGADGIQYAYLIPASGRVYRLRDEWDVLWHCANAEGNSRSIAVHLPLDSTHDATPAQWAGFEALVTYLSRRYDWRTRQVVKGHREWPRRDGKPQSPCPGPLLTRRLIAWRGETPTPNGASWYRTRTEANVREGPGLRFPVALGGRAVLPAGATFFADGVTLGDPVGGDRRWAHRADGLGFVHLSILEAV